MIEPQELRRRVEIALAEGGDVMTFDDMIELARAGRIQLWADDESVVATEIMVYPRKKVLNLFLAAGRLPAVMAWHPKLTQFCHDNEVDLMVAFGAPGWGRIGRRNGWRFRAMVFVNILRGMH
jgi:hypothetical protein